MGALVFTFVFRGAESAGVLALGMSPLVAAFAGEGNGQKALA